MESTSLLKVTETKDLGTYFDSQLLNLIMQTNVIQITDKILFGLQFVGMEGWIQCS